MSGGRGSSAGGTYTDDDPVWDQRLEGDTHGERQSKGLDIALNRQQCAVVRGTLLPGERGGLGGGPGAGAHRRIGFSAAGPWRAQSAASERPHQSEKGVRRSAALFDGG